MLTSNRTTTPRSSTSASARRSPSATRSASVVLPPCASRCLHDEAAYSTLLSHGTTGWRAHETFVTIRCSTRVCAFSEITARSWSWSLGEKHMEFGQRRSGNQWQLNHAAVLLLYDTLVFFFHHPHSSNYRDLPHANTFTHRHRQIPRHHNSVSPTAPPSLHSPFTTSSDA